MSASMHVRQVPTKPAGVYVETGLHWRIAPRLFNHDGSMAGTVRVHAGDADYHYLIGVRDGLPESDPGRETLKVIIEMMEKYDIIEIEISR